MLAAVWLAQHGACWVCGQHVSLRDAELDRLVNGDAAGVCAGSAVCSGHDRCAYAFGNVAAAHRDCHAPDGVRYRMGDAWSLARWVALGLDDPAFGLARWEEAANARRLALAEREAAIVATVARLAG